jgi:3-oxoadipate CoA-transferase beta subunit
MTERLNRTQIAWRVGRDIPDGSFVNLGIGMPELVANYLPEDREIVFQSENGILGMGPRPEAGEEDEELVNAGKKLVTLLPGGSFFHHADSFAMIRGGHIDICVLGAFQVSKTGDLANWTTSMDALPGVGGAMDLVAGSKRVFIMTTHTTKKGDPKIVEECTLPLTGKECVSTVYSDLAVIDFGPDGPIVREKLEDLEFDELQDKTGVPLRLANDWKPLQAPALD